MTFSADLHFCGSATPSSLSGMTILDLSAEVAQLRRERTRLAEEIVRQEKLLARLRGDVAVAQRNGVAKFDAAVEVLSPWEQESRAGLIRKLRARVEAGEDIGDLRVLCRESRIER